MSVVFPGHTYFLDYLFLIDQGKRLSNTSKDHVDDGDDATIMIKNHSYMGLVARKPVLGVSDKVRLKPVYTATETS